MSGARWFRDRFRDAVWECETLTADHKAVAETYARHARDGRGDKSAWADLAWLTYDRLQAGAGIRRRSNVKKILDDLEGAGWLVVVQRVHRRPTVYRLAIPQPPATTPEPVPAGGGSTASGVVGAVGGTTVVPPGRTTVVPAVVASRDHGSHTLTGRGGVGSADVGTPPSEELPSISSPSGAIRAADLRRVTAATGADEHQAAAIIAKIQADNHITRSLTGYLHAITDADLRHHHAALHHQPDHAAAEDTAAFEQRRRTAPACVHDHPAGALIHPTTRRALCPLCHRGRPPITPNRGKPGQSLSTDPGVRRELPDRRVGAPGKPGAWDAGGTAAREASVGRRWLR
ncbi:hypothetical protein [Longispora fulva]|uniref:Uncharacterized protein n=1 Tax=Longispora fulva TaxID=619741 RepID=A0A8J7KDE9_9ACTN|nr:hypothetical protein [Longispora fulva]MBG6133965.1 hypothetical protein [Longispora fulva]